jgi:hypothetical protein
VTVKRIKAALTRKLGPLPAWGWTLIAFAGVYYWRHRNAAASQTATGTAAGVAAGAGYGYGDVGSGGGGGGGGLPPDAQPLADAPTQADGAPVSWDPTQAQAPNGATPTTSSPASSSPAPSTTIRSDPLPFALPGAGRGSSQPLAPAANPLSVLNLSGGLTQPLMWGGKTFYTQTAFQAWARQHGSTVRGELARHPEAARVYAQLIPTDITQTVVAPKTTKAQTRTRTSTAAPPPAPADRPISVRSVPAPRVIAHPAQATKPKKATASRSMPATKAAAAFAPPSRIPGLVPNPVTNPIRTAAPSQAPRRLAVEAPAPLPANEAFRLLNPVVAAPAPAATRVVAQAPPVLPTVGNETTRVAPRGRMIAV